MRNAVNYCENCRVACYEKACPNCGKKKLKAVEDEDFCFVLQEANSRIEYFCNILEEKGIKTVNMPWFSALDTHLAVKSSVGRLFVQFKDLDEARKTVQNYFDEITENLRKHLLDNFGQFSIDEAVEKKARKKLKIRDDIDIFDYCGDIIYEAKEIKDTHILLGSDCEHILLVLSEKEKLYINSVTYNIISLGKR